MKWVNWLQNFNLKKKWGLAASNTPWNYVDLVWTRGMRSVIRHHMVAKGWTRIQRSNQSSQLPGWSRVHGSSVLVSSDIKK